MIRSHFVSLVAAFNSHLHFTVFVLFLAALSKRTVPLSERSAVVPRCVHLGGYYCILKKIQFLTSTDKILELLVKGNSYTNKLYYKTPKGSIPLVILI